MTALHRAVASLVLVAGGLATAAPPVRAGQVHAQKVTLEALVKGAAAIVVVTPARPPLQRRTIKITKPGSARRYPPFAYVVHRYDVVRVLKNTDGRALGKRLLVYPSGLDTRRSVHEGYYLRGISKSWIEETYEPRQPPAAEQPLVVFLARDRTGWSFAAHGAVESAALEADIRALIGQP